MRPSPSQRPPGAPSIHGDPVLLPAHKGQWGPVRLAGQQGRLAHGGIHCRWSRPDGGHRWRRSTEGADVGAAALSRAQGAGHGGAGRGAHCGSPRGRPHWCCLRHCGLCSCSRRCRLCSGPAAGGTCLGLGTGCGCPPVEQHPPGGGEAHISAGPSQAAPRHQSRSPRKPMEADKGLCSVLGWPAVPVLTPN